MTSRPPVKLGKFIEPVWIHIKFKGNHIRGKKARKESKHQWLRAAYGRPSYCMNSMCDKKSTWYDWALKRKKKYSHNPSDYLWLCRRCHRKYDMTEKLRKAAIKNLWWAKGVPNPNEQGKNGITRTAIERLEV